MENFLVRKSLAFILSAVLAIETAAIPLAQAAQQEDIWTARHKASQNVQFAGLPILEHMPPAAPSSLKSEALHQLETSLPLPSRGKFTNLLKALPSQLGTVRDIHIPKNSNGRVLVHIQDVHMHKEAQGHISQAIQSLMKNNRIDSLLLEGAFEAVDLRPFRDFPYPALIRQTADFFLGKNEISGGLHGYLCAASAGTAITGIDHQGHYSANVQAYKDSALRKNAVAADLENQKKEMRENKEKIFNPDLMKFDRLVEGYRKGTIPVGDYVRVLLKRDDQMPDQIGLFLEALDLERSLNFQQVERERKSLLEKMIARMTQQQTEQLLAQTSAYRSGQISHSQFYGNLKSFCGRLGIPLTSSPEMNRYLQYVLLADKIEGEALMAQLDALEKSRYASLSSTVEEKKLVARSRHLFLTSRLIDFSLTPSEWNEYKPLPTADSLVSFEKFYQEAESRDHAMADNVIKAIEKGENKLSVLVTGGFHAEGIRKALDKKGITVVSFVPRVTQLEEAGNTSYLSVFTQEKTPLQQLFEGNKLFLSPLQLDRATVIKLGIAVIASAILSRFISMEQGPEEFRNLMSSTAPEAVLFGISLIGSAVTMSLRWGSRQVRLFVESNEFGLKKFSSEEPRFTFNTSGFWTWIPGVTPEFAVKKLSWWLETFIVLNVYWVLMNHGGILWALLGTGTFIGLIHLVRVGVSEERYVSKPIWKTLKGEQASPEMIKREIIKILSQYLKYSFLFIFNSLSNPLTDPTSYRQLFTGAAFFAAYRHRYDNSKVGFSTHSTDFQTSRFNQKRLRLGRNISVGLVIVGIILLGSLILRPHIANPAYLVAIVSWMPSFASVFSVVNVKVIDLYDGEDNSQSLAKQILKKILPSLLAFSAAELLSATPFYPGWLISEVFQGADLMAVWAAGGLTFLIHWTMITLASKPAPALSAVSKGRVGNFQGLLKKRLDKAKADGRLVGVVFSGKNVTLKPGGQVQSQADKMQPYLKQIMDIVSSDFEKDPYRSKKENEKLLSLGSFNLYIDEDVGPTNFLLYEGPLVFILGHSNGEVYLPFNLMSDLLDIALNGKSGGDEVKKIKARRALQFLVRHELKHRATLGWEDPIEVNHILTLLVDLGLLPLNESESVFYRANSREALREAYQRIWDEATRMVESGEAPAPMADVEDVSSLTLVAPYDESMEKYHRELDQKIDEELPEFSGILTPIDPKARHLSLFSPLLEWLGESYDFELIEKYIPLIRDAVRDAKPISITFRGLNLTRDGTIILEGDPDNEFIFDLKRKLGDIFPDAFRRSFMAHVAVRRYTGRQLSAEEFKKIYEFVKRNRPGSIPPANPMVLSTVVLRQSKTKFATEDIAPRRFEFNFKGRSDYSRHIVAEPEIFDLDQNLLTDKGLGLVIPAKLGLPVPDFRIVMTSLMKQHKIQNLNFTLLALEILESMHIDPSQPFNLVVRAAGVYNMPGILRTVDEGVHNVDSLAKALQSVYGSWDAPNAQAYLKNKNIDPESGMAVIVQHYVNGIGENSGAGVGYTRHPHSEYPLNEGQLYGRYLKNARGRDVMSGSARTDFRTIPDNLVEDFPGLVDQFNQVKAVLDDYYMDSQEFEFVIENGKLWLTQTTRNTEYSKPTYVLREGAQVEELARGGVLSIGAVDGHLCFTPEEAERRKKEGKQVILVFPNILDENGVQQTPNNFMQALFNSDIDGVILLYESEHEGKLARGRHIPMISVFDALLDGEYLKLPGAAVKRGDRVVLNGSEGTVLAPKEEKVLEYFETKTLRDRGANVQEIEDQLKKFFQSNRALDTYVNLAVLHSVMFANVTQLETLEPESVERDKLDFATKWVHRRALTKAARDRQQEGGLETDIDSQMQKTTSEFYPYVIGGESENPAFVMRDLADFFGKAQGVIDETVAKYRSLKIAAVEYPSYDFGGENQVESLNGRMHVEFTLTMEGDVNLERTNFAAAEMVLQPRVYARFSIDNDFNRWSGPDPNHPFNPNDIPLEDLSWGVDLGSRDKNKIRVRGTIPFPRAVVKAAFTLRFESNLGTGGAQWLTVQDPGYMVVRFVPPNVENRIGLMMRDKKYSERAQNAARFSAKEITNALIDQLEDYPEQKINWEPVQKSINFMLDRQVLAAHSERSGTLREWIGSRYPLLLNVNHLKNGAFLMERRTPENYTVEPDYRDFYRTQALAMMLNRMFPMIDLEAVGVQWVGPFVAKGDHGADMHNEYYASWLPADQYIVEKLADGLFQLQNLIDVKDILTLDESGRIANIDIEGLILAMYSKRQDIEGVNAFREDSASWLDPAEHPIYARFAYLIETTAVFIALTFLAWMGFNPLILLLAPIIFWGGHVFKNPQALIGRNVITLTMAKTMAVVGAWLILNFDTDPKTAVLVFMALTAGFSIWHRSMNRNANLASIVEERLEGKSLYLGVGEVLGKSLARSEIKVLEISDNNHYHVELLMRNLLRWIKEESSDNRAAIVHVVPMAGVSEVELAQMLAHTMNVLDISAESLEGRLAFTFGSEFNGDAFSLESVLTEAVRKNRRTDYDLPVAPLREFQAVVTLVQTTERWEALESQTIQWGGITIPLSNVVSVLVDFLNDEIRQGTLNDRMDGHRRTKIAA